MTYFIFVYVKDDKAKALNLEEANEHHVQLIKEGWTHIETLDAHRYIEQQFTRKVQQ